MKKFFLILLFLPIVVTAQRDSTRHDTLILDKFFNFVGKGLKKTFHSTHLDTCRHKQRQKFQIDFSYELGPQYQSLLRNHYFPMDTIPYFSPGATYSTLPPGRVGITYKPTLGFFSGISIGHTFKRNFRIETGLQFQYRQEKYIEDDDTLERNIVNNFNLHNNPYYPVLDTFTSFQNSYFNFIVPVYFGYSYKRFNSSIGLKLPVFTFYRTRYNTLHNLEILYRKSNRFFDDTGALSIKFEYLITNKKLNISTYLAVDGRGRQYYDFLVGLKFKCRR